MLLANGLVLAVILYAWLKYFFAVPPAAEQQSTWPGEENCQSDGDSKAPQSGETLTGIDYSDKGKKADGNKLRARVIKHALIEEFVNYKGFFCLPIVATEQLNK
ncbi:hypothetical protein GCM10028819_17760 [Spirosoma humi]